MSEILHLNKVQDFNDFLGVETLHPFVSVVDLSTAKPVKNSRKNYGFYTIFLKDVKCGDLRYGRSYYDYQEGTLVFISPGQMVGDDDNGQLLHLKGWALMFHPDLLRGTPLSRRMKEYLYFSYEVNESLHISERERQLVINSFIEIRDELERSIDKHSKSIITASIEVLLNYCMRFYDRQFITRENVNKDLLSRFEKLLNSYFDSERPHTIGLPSVQYCAGQLHLSANYFGDLIKRETGKSAQDYIQLKLIDCSKDKLYNPAKSVNEIAYELGFKYPHHFSRLFKKVVGCSPSDYRGQTS